MKRAYRYLKAHVFQQSADHFILRRHLISPKLLRASILPFVDTCFNMVMVVLETRHEVKVKMAQIRSVV